MKSPVSSLIEVLEDRTMLSVQVLSHTLNGGDNIRSGIRELTFEFDGNVTFASAASLKLFNHTTGQAIDLSAATLVNNGTASVTWDLSSLMLPDGRYTAEVSASSTAPALQSTRAFEFYKLAGDADGYGFVNFNDFFEVDVNFGTTGAAFGPGDSNGDGVVNFDDFLDVDAHFNTRVDSWAFDFAMHSTRRACPPYLPTTVRGT